MTTEIEELFAKATPRPWEHRPCEHDDWGFIRGPEIEMSFGPGRPIAAIAGACWPYDADEHRRNKTDPCEPNAALIVHAVNNIERLTSENEALREALAPFAAEAENYDYGDGSGPDLKFAPDESSLNEINDLLVGHLRTARAALSKKGEAE